MQNTTAFGHASTPEELRHARYLDALIAFRPSTCLAMTQGAPEGGSGSGGDGAGGAAGGGQGGQGGGAGSGGSGGAGSGRGGAGNGGGTGSDTGMATDDQGNSLGFPKDTRVAEMNDKEAAAYWRHQSQKHEGRYKSLTGDRSFDDAKAALAEAERLQREQQTPAEQALADARTEGQKAGARDAFGKAATAIFRGALEAAEISADDITELTDNFNVAGYITDDGVDAAKIAAFAKRFTPGTGTSGDGRPPRTRDFGGGQRPDPQAPRGSAGKAEAEKRFGSKTPTQ